MNKFFQEAGIPSEKVIRFSAIRDSPGIVGAAKSHISVLKMIRNNGWENALILEDDMKWVTYSNETILEHIQKPFDVFMLGGFYVTIVDGNRPLKSYHTCAYIVKKYYVSKLLNNFETGLNRLLSTTFTLFPSLEKHRIKNDHDHHVDVYWCRLQQTDNWRCIVPPMVTQIDSYSDNMEK